ncbi:hypothetical protein [Xanthobacter wiegelii]|uniref:hypothetical protein n=1 Tax=Xanthobacter wiegelii TaxID=3119913 RepID=UPI00372B4FA8
MGRLLPFSLPKRRSRGRAREAAPAEAIAPGTAGAATCFELKAERAARRARSTTDLIGAAGAYATTATLLALTAAFLPASIALAQMAHLARETDRRP